jgi:hypothetical protein
MPQRDGAAVYVDFLRIEAGFPDDGQRLHAEGFVQFDHADVVQRQAGDFEGLGMATTGPMPMISGGTPPAEKLTKRAMGFRPSSRALRSDMTMAAAAPSLVCEELPAVTVPLAWKTGFSLASASRWYRRAALRPWRKPFW